MRSIEKEKCREKNHHIKKEDGKDVRKRWKGWKEIRENKTELKMWREALTEQAVYKVQE